MLSASSPPSPTNVLTGCLTNGFGLEANALCFVPRARTTSVLSEPSCRASAHAALWCQPGAVSGRGDGQ